MWTYKYQCKLSYEHVTDQEQDIDVLESNTFRNIYKEVIKIVFLLEIPIL